MKCFHITVVVASLLALADLTAHADFQNLDFEMATVTPAPSGYTPFDASPPILAADALPFWTVREDGTVCSAIWGGPNALDETSVALVDGSSGYPNYPSLQGAYSIQLYAWADAPPNYFHTASISQTGLVPVGTHSIQFLIRSPPVAGGSVQAMPTVTLNGTPINIFPVFTSSGVITMAGDISAFAGITADLSILCAGTSGAGNLSQNIFALDAISFSTQVVPEPTTLSLFALGSFLLGWRWRKSARP